MDGVAQLDDFHFGTPDAEPWNRRRYGGSRASDPRSSYEIDRDRIIHSDTFRALQYKTQVQGLIRARWPRVFRTRLNHVLEVAQIARGLSREVGANEALSEAIALAHDLGHPPFGHAGERALRAELQRRGLEDWNANLHSLVVVDDVEAAFIEFRGLDLTWSTREGIARHSTPFDVPETAGEFVEGPNAGLEAQIVDASDIFAWLSHDLDDALAGTYMTLDEVAAADSVLFDLVESAMRRWGDRPADVWPEGEKEALVRQRLRAMLLYRLINDAASATKVALETHGILTAADVRSAEERVVKPSPAYASLVSALLETLTHRYYRSRDVSESDAVATKLINGLFAALIAQPLEIPPRFRVGDDVVNTATYVASLNDHSAAELARQFGVEADF